MAWIKVVEGEYHAVTGYSYCGGREQEQDCYWQDFQLVAFGEVIFEWAEND